MGASKTTQFKQETIQLALVARALSHPARIKILESIRSNNRIFRCIDMCTILQLSKSTVHEHLHKMQEGGIIRLSHEKQWYNILPIIEGVEEFHGFLVEKE